MNLVSELDLPVFDYSAADFSADRYHQQLAETRQRGWLAKSPLAYMVLDHDAGEFFLRSRKTAFPGRQLAEFFGVTSGPLAEHIDANILNLGGEQHRRLRGLVGPALTPRAADRWRPVMRGFLRELWEQVATRRKCDFAAAVAQPYPSLTIAAVLDAPYQDAWQLHAWSSWVQRQFDIRALEMNRDDIERAVCSMVADEDDRPFTSSPTLDSNDLVRSSITRARRILASFSAACSAARRSALIMLSLNT